MRPLNIYFSRSKEVDDNEFWNQLEILQENFNQFLPVGTMLTYHEKGTQYNPQLVESADLIIVGTRDNLIKTQVPDIAKGCFSEIERGFEKNIPVALLALDNTSFVREALWCLQLLDSDCLSIEDKDNWSIGYGFLCPNYTLGYILDSKPSDATVLGNPEDLFEWFKYINTNRDIKEFAPYNSFDASCRYAGNYKKISEGDNWSSQDRLVTEPCFAKSHQGEQEEKSNPDRKKLLLS